jgi:hypothetical protein
VCVFDFKWPDQRESTNLAILADSEWEKEDYKLQLNRLGAEWYMTMAETQIYSPFTVNKFHPLKDLTLASRRVNKFH